MIRMTVSLRSGQLEYEKRKLKAVMRASGGEVAAETRSLLNSSQGGGRTYRGSGGHRYRPYRKGAYQASAAGQPPVRVTGTLQGCVVVLPFRSGEGVAIRNRKFYSLFLEMGAAGGRPGSRNVRQKRGGRSVRVKTVGARILLPRPSLTAALQMRGDSIEQRIRQSITEDIKFVRQKVIRRKR
jgi:hypothetical protein